MPRTFAFLAHSFPHPVATFLAQHGYVVIEAHSPEEAMSLSEWREVDAVILAGGEDWPGVAEVRDRRITLNLEIHATGSDVFFELSNILAMTPSRPQ